MSRAVRTDTVRATEGRSLPKSITRDCPKAACVPVADTPIGRILATLRASAPGVPALIEYDYVGLHASVDELKACMAYCRRAMATTPR